MSDAQERTEQATDKRMKEVREKGKLQRSQDLTAWLAVGAALSTLPVVIPAATDAAATQFFTALTVASAPEPGRALAVLGDGLGSVLPTLAPMLAAAVAGVLAGAVLQGRITFRKFTPKFEHFNPVTGLKGTFGPQALWKGLQALLKTVVVGLVLYLVVQAAVPVLMSSGSMPITAVLAHAGESVATMLQVAVAAGVGLAVVDVLVVRKRNTKQTRMSRKEVQDEQKNSDGDPLIRSQRRARQRALSRNRMIAAVADADVVLVNPTHVAVALKYDAGKAAPRVCAKGQGHVATRIREEAERHRVPMVRDVPLARALHKECRLGEEIPVDRYGEVAAVLAFVMRLRRRGNAGGVHTVPPGSTARAGTRPGRTGTRSSPAHTGPAHTGPAPTTTRPGGTS